MLLAATKVTKEAALNSVNSPMTPIIVGVVAALVFILLAVLVANMIKFDPGANPKDKQKRRLWFWILGVLATVVAFVLIYFAFPPITSIEVFSDMRGVTKDDIQKFTVNYNKYMLWSGISTAGTFVLYVLLGFILSKLFKTKKIGNWF
jgi:succinate dehydrogenase/fumarate reductase cytochrome b subunit